MTRIRISFGSLLLVVLVIAIGGAGARVGGQMAQDALMDACLWPGITYCHDGRLQEDLD